MLSNLEGLIFADDQAGFLTGLIAGGVSSGLSKKVGVIGGLPIPPVKRFANGFKLGVEHACPDCSSTIIYCPFGGANDGAGVPWRVRRRGVRRGRGTLLDQQRRGRDLWRGRPDGQRGHQVRLGAAGHGG